MLVLFSYLRAVFPIFTVDSGASPVLCKKRKDGAPGCPLLDVLISQK